MRPRRCNGGMRRRRDRAGCVGHRSALLAAGADLRRRQQATSSTAATKAANAAAAKAAAAAAATAAANSGPNAQFVSAITSQLTGLVAESIAQKIANTTSGGGGTIQSGSTSITYTNVDGELTVDIVSPSGATTLTIPTVN